MLSISLTALTVILKTTVTRLSKDDCVGLSVWMDEATFGFKKLFAFFHVLGMILAIFEVCQ